MDVELWTERSKWNSDVFVGVIYCPSGLGCWVDSDLFSIIKHWNDAASVTGSSSDLVQFMLFYQVIQTCKAKSNRGWHDPDVFTVQAQNLTVCCFFPPIPSFHFLAHQFHCHHLLRCVSEQRILRCGHLRDDLRHGLLRHLHDGNRQADPSGQLGLERESATCLTTRCYSRHAHMLRSFTMLRLLLPSFVQDLFRAGIGAALYIITSLICVIGGAGDGALIAGGVSLTVH